MKNRFYQKIEAVLFGVMGLLMGVLLIHLWITPNEETWQSRKLTGYERIQNVSYEVLEDNTAPTGMVRQFTFQISDAIAYDSTLVFKFSHQNAAVYLDDELVYSLQTAKENRMIRTPGINWAMIPLYDEDMGKAVRVVLTPVYRDYQEQEISFLVGSRLDIYKEQLIQALPEMSLSLINILTGLVLLCVAVYFSVKKMEGTGFYTLALLAITLGLWNFTQTEFAPFLLQDKTVFTYYISLTMLMSCVVPLIKSVRTSQRKFINGTLLAWWCLICGGASVAQLVIQLLGILDLREMLKVTHGMIVISSLLLIASSLVEWHRERNDGKTIRGTSGIWILGVGALLDMVIYYAQGGSIGLLFVLIAILCYVLMEGVRMLLTYNAQKQMLEEKENQLAMSRVTTMMSQIRSHFVFNLLNAISGMCKYDPEQADDTIVRFSRYLRNNIDIMESDKNIPFTTDLKQLEDYVILEQVRFGDRLEFYTDIEADQFMIPPLILQPVVENAIKHGLSKKDTGGIIILRTRDQGGNIVITVEDDGVGFDMTALHNEKSVGLRNIRFRLRHLVNGTLDIESHVGQGTVVTITIPKE